jgi:hypothetical protein
LFDLSASLDFFMNVPIDLVDTLQYINPVDNRDALVLRMHPKDELLVPTDLASSINAQVSKFLRKKTIAAVPKALNIAQARAERSGWLQQDNQFLAQDRRSIQQARAAVKDNSGVSFRIADVAPAAVKSFAKAQALTAPKHPTNRKRKAVSITALVPLVAPASPGETPDEVFTMLRFDENPSKAVARRMGPLQDGGDDSAQASLRDLAVVKHSGEDATYSLYAGSGAVKGDFKWVREFATIPVPAVEQRANVVVLLTRQPGGKGLQSAEYVSYSKQLGLRKRPGRSHAIMREVIARPAKVILTPAEGSNKRQKTSE